MAKRCDLCGENRFQIIARRDRRGRELLIDLCLECGLVMHHEIPTEQDLHEFYARQYRWQYHGETTPSARRVMRAWRVAQELVDRIAPLLPAGANILDVGAGIGCVVKQFEMRGFTATGIEPGLGFQGYARQIIRADVRCATLEDLPLVAAYDAILLVHVIEHLRSPRQSLRRLHQMLRPGGLLYVACPNLGAPFARRAKLFHYAHIYNFTRETLGMLAESCGYACVRWLSDERDPELCVLLRREQRSETHVSPSGCRATLEALERYNLVTYHLRWCYIRPRLAKLAL